MPPERISKMKVVIWIISALLGMFVAGLAFVYFSPDYDMFVVRSESMTPAIKMGDMIVTGPASGPFGGGIEPGTIVTYSRGTELVTHRIVSLGNGTIITKGDANEDPDQVPVTEANIKGVVLFKIPFIGFLTGFIRTKLGWFLTILIPAAILIGFLIKDILKEAFKDDKQSVI